MRYQPSPKDHHFDKIEYTRPENASTQITTFLVNCFFWEKLILSMIAYVQI